MDVSYPLKPPACGVAVICFLIPAKPFGRISPNCFSVMSHFMTHLWIFWSLPWSLAFKISVSFLFFYFFLHPIFTNSSFPCIWCSGVKLNIAPVSKSQKGLSLEVSSLLVLLILNVNIEFRGSTSFFLFDFNVWRGRRSIM